MRTALQTWSFAVLAGSLLAGVHGFGNLAVNWQAEGTDGATTPLVTLGNGVDKTHKKDFKAPPDIRRSNLETLPIAELSSILTGMGRTCERCVSVGHWTSKVRHTVLELQNKALKAQLSKRGVRCEACSQREQYIDRLLDSVHLPYVVR